MSAIRSQAGAYHYPKHYNPFTVSVVPSGSRKAKIQSATDQTRRDCRRSYVSADQRWGVGFANIDFTTHRVDREKVSIGTVLRGTMEVKVSANGQLLSEKHRTTGGASSRPGREEGCVKAGAVVQVGQLLVELTNPQLVASAQEAQSAWEGAVAGLQVPDAMLQTNMLNQEVVLTQAQFNLQTAQLKLETDEALAREHDVFRKWT